MVNTRNFRRSIVQSPVLAGLGSLLVTIQPVIAQNSGFNYHGFLTDQHRPADAIYDMRFTIYDSADGGNAAAETVDADDLSVTNGLFSITLDFGAEAFDGADRWLEIAVRPGTSNGEFTTVVPRQKIMATPYAIRAASLSGPVDASQITGKLSASVLEDGTLTAEKLAAGAVVAQLSGDSENNLVLDGSGLTNLNASELASGTIPDARFPAVLPAIDGSRLTGIPRGTGIDALDGSGTNTTLVNPSYSGIMSSTNAYPVVHGIPGNSQIWNKAYTGDPNAAPFTFLTTYASNNFNPMYNAPSPYQPVNDVQLKYGYNIGGVSDFRTDLMSWERGLETCWFNGGNEPQIEVYDRIRLPNGNLGGEAGSSYTVGLESGHVAVLLYGHTVGFSRPGSGGIPWMTANVDSSGLGTLVFNNGSILFSTATNEWNLAGPYGGLIGNYGGAKALFYSVGGNDNITLFKGAASAGSDLSLSFGNIQVLRWNGTNTSNQALEYRKTDGSWGRFNSEVSPRQKSYTLTANALIGEAAGDYRTMGTLTADNSQTVSAQFDLWFDGGDDQVSQRYVVPETYGTQHADWQELLPLHESSRNNVKHYAVDTRFNSGRREFRVRRIKATGLGSGYFNGVVTVYGGTWTNDVSGSGSDATVTQISANTPLIQTGGKVGINTNNPQAALDVGNAGQIFSSGFLVRSNAWPGPELHAGDVWYGSSNGIPYVKYLVDGVPATARLVPE